MKETKKQETPAAAQKTTGPALVGPSELERFKKELADKETVINDYANHLKRLQAEFENYCKRIDKERKDVIEHASERIIVKLLLVIDDFERALTQLKDVPSETRKGIEIIFKNLHKILDEEHVAPIVCVGHKLDPYKHEVLLQTQSDAAEDTVIEELQRGYTMNGKVIRYAKVKIAKPKQDKKTDKQTHATGGN